MCQSSLTVTAIIILVGGPSGRRASQTITDSPSAVLAPDRTPGTRIFPRQAEIDETATYNSLTNAESTEEQQGYTYNSYYAPSTVNFHDIYSNSLAMLAEDPLLTTPKEDDAFHLHNMPTKYVEFHPQTQTIPPVTLPPPMFLLNVSYIKNDTEANTTTSSTSTTTEEPEEIINVQVIPIKKDYQRGVLDLLFPAARVRTFKSVFDTFKRLMSHTFR